MVSLGVPTARFGKPPDPANPQPHYPGISSQYDPMSALTVYRETLTKERDLTANFKENINECKGPVPHTNHLTDIMPGRGSVAETYKHLGFRINPATGVAIAPEVKPRRPLQPHDLGSETNSQVCSSRVAAASGSSRRVRSGSGSRQMQKPLQPRRSNASSRPVSAQEEEPVRGSRQERSPGPSGAAHEPKHREATALLQHGDSRRPGSAQNADRGASDRRGRGPTTASKQSTLALQQSASTPGMKNLHWDCPRLPEFKSHFDLPSDGVCRLSQKDKHNLAREKAMIHKNCGQNRVFCFI
eukprot:TRINITY_DN28587_c0_g2_i1.p1 TRINITY_DN28587_c0_g2~~TRINITY_DN28587_c0_g2_i1.p1  ORF type:complete len:300 (-),score=29.24 TRINITY_DN28587_c0_g2_i1:102-1001(-)